jgi:phosphatidylglycerol:prolipoprotein diacylglycerol transferase
MIAGIPQFGPLPVLQIGSLAIQTYPLAMLAAVWVTLAVGARLATRLGIDGDHIYNAGLSGLAAGLVAGRVAHVIVYWPAYRLEPLSIVGLNARAFLLWPGVLAGAAAFGYYVYRNRLPLAIVLDATLTGGLLGMAIAQLGVWLAGLDPGAPAELPWALTEWGVRRHPVQLYQVVILLLAFGAALVVLRRESRSGRAAWTALLGYGFCLWFIEPFRETSIMLPGGLRALQLVGLAAMLVALMVLRPQPEATKMKRVSEATSGRKPG